MKQLLTEIRRILRDRRTRRLLTRLVSTVAALVVFITTYALVLPAITMESLAECGIEEHQHIDACYENVLTCGKTESDGHHHTEECFEKVLTCGKEVHTHSTSCYKDHAGSADTAKTAEETAVAAGTSLIGVTADVPGNASADASPEASGSASTDPFSGDPAVPLSDNPADSFTGENADPSVSVSGGDFADASGNDGFTDISGDNAFTDVDDNDSGSASAAVSGKDSDSANTDDNNSAELKEADLKYGSENAGDGKTETAAAALTTLTDTDNDADSYVPQLDPLYFDAVLNDRTGIYRHAAADGETIEDGSAVPAQEWTRIPDDTENTDTAELGENDLLRVYLAYTIPAGSLNQTNPAARYRLPANLHLSDAQVRAVNETVNGMASQYVDYETLEITDPDLYKAYLGAAAVEGTRTPTDDPEAYLAKLGKTGSEAAEYISATVTVENVYDMDGIYGEKGAYLGQDLIFTFTPYSIEKNRHEYDRDGQPTKAGRKIEGWLTIDLSPGQIDWSEPAVTTSDQSVGRETDERTERTADIVFVQEGKDGNGHTIHEISTTLKLVEETGAEPGPDQENQPAEEDPSNKDKDQNGKSDADDKSEEDSADKDTPDENGSGENAADKSSADEKADSAAAGPASEGTDSAAVMPAMSFNDKITVSTGKPAGLDENAGGTVANAAEALPEEAEVTVRVEADEGTFPAGTTMVLKAVDQNVIDGLADTLAETAENSASPAHVGNEGGSADKETGKEDQPGVSPEKSGDKKQGDNGKNEEKDNRSDEKKKLKTYGFQAVDITFFDAEGNEIEPVKPVRVTLTSGTVKKVREEAKESAIADPVVVHIDNDGNAEQMDLAGPKGAGPSGDAGEEDLDFQADSFSVYAIVYTVDFHYDVDGKTYDYSIMGGETISLKQLLPVLHVIRDDTSTETDEVQIFINDIDSVRFSDESLVRVAKIDEDITAGKLKENLDLHPEYSRELTKEQIEEKNGMELKAIDWALVSMKAFDTKEALTVSMKSGEEFVIVVTDARDPNSLDGRTVSIVCQNGGKYSVTVNSAGNGIQAKSTTVRDGNGNAIGDIYSTAETTLYSDTGDTAWMIRYDTASGGYFLENNGRYLVFTGSGLSIVTNADQKQPVFITKNRTVTEEAVTDEDENVTYTYTYGDWDGTYLLSNKAPLVVDDEETGHQSAPEGLKYLRAGTGSFSLTDSAAAAARVRPALPENPTSASHKASMISATSIQSGQRLVIYQRVLQADDRYKTYAIDGDGNLVEVKENSDSVYWVENDPSIIWKITEVLGSNGASSGYYTLQNEKTGLFLTPKDAPGAAESQAVHVLSDFEDGDAKHLNISLPGAAGGQYTSTISCWDYDANVTYGLAVAGGSDRSGTMVPASMNVPELTESQAFYFAACDPIVTDQLTTVDTVDSKAMGIKISMYDFHDTTIINYARQQYMTQIMGNDGWAQGSYAPGFLSRTLGADGYPVIVKNGTQNIPANNQKSLRQLFEYSLDHPTSTNPKTTIVEDVNHLFLKSVYDESGFFKYSCFENFAQLNKTPNEDGSTDFTVYEQVGVPWKEFDSSGQYNNQWEGRHDYYERGNFMPFDELTTDNGHRTVNKDEDLNTLPDTDARKGEPLYYIKNVNNGNYYFGMIMEGSFTQKPGGLSDRGDPMVYEFNGDDDMWVYLDGVLVLDIGGVHDAFRGSINFRTGRVEVVGPQITQQGTSGRQGEVTWIKEQYYQAGKLPDGSDWPTQNGVKKKDDPRIDAFFTNDGQSSDGKLIGTFKDYSTHDFKMFYMERGAGASNLELMFNLTLAPEAGFRVKKELPSTNDDKVVQTQYADAPFFYQAYVRDKGRDEDYHLYIPNEDKTQPPYTDSEPYYETIVQKDDGSLETQKTAIEWKDRENGIFVVKPGQTAFFPVREKHVEWYVKEIPSPENPQMLDHFDVTNTDPSSYDPPYTENEEYRVDKNGTVTKSRTVTERGVVAFDNYPDDTLVNELQITKKLKGTMYKDPRTASGLVEAVENNSPYFEYKIFLESTEGEVVPYSLGPYYQKDKDGNYVYYEKGQRKNPETGTFSVEVEAGTSEEFSYKYVYQTLDTSKAMGWFGPILHRNGTTTYEGFRKAEGTGYVEYTYEPKVTEHTSINGSLGDIRDGDTVIVKGLMVGTTFVVDERTDRSNMIKGTPGEDTDRKYLFEDTDVTGAFTGQTDDEELQSHIDANMSLYTNNPPDADNVSYSGKAGKGVIIPDEDAHVLVKNQGEPPFSLTLQKKWPEDVNLEDLDDDAKVIFTLKRFKINEKRGTFTLKADVTGQPNFDPVYLIRDQNGTIIRTVTFSSMDENRSFDELTQTDHREKTLKLPIGGPYYVEYGTGTNEDNTPYGYDVTNSPVLYGDGQEPCESFTVVRIEPDEGGPVPDPEVIATPDEATVSSIFRKHTGSIIIQKTLTGDANLYGNFKAKYIITGSALDSPIEIETPGINGGNGGGENQWLNGVWTTRVDDLIPGRYTVTEQILEDGPGIPEHKPTKRVARVTKDGEEALAFEGSYTSSKIPVTIYCQDQNGVTRHTYKSKTGFDPGSQLTVSLTAKYNQYNGAYSFSTSSGQMDTFNGNNWGQASITLNLPLNGELTVSIQHHNRDAEYWLVTVNDNNFEEVTGNRAASAPRRMMLSRALTAEGPDQEEAQPTIDIGTAANPVRNTITPLTCDPDTQFVVEDESWALEVALSNSLTAGGKKKDHVVTVSGTVEDEPVSADMPEQFIVDPAALTWTAEIDAQTLASLNLPSLDASDEDGNLYYYYVYAVREEKVPQGTVVSFDKDGDKTIYVSEENKEPPLSVTNKLVTAFGPLQITKVVTVNDGDPAASANKALAAGTFVFTITGASGTATESEEHIVRITFANGRATSYQIDENAAVNVTGTDNTWTVPVPDLPVGTYTITETGSGQLRLKTVTGGNGDGNAAAKTVTVTVEEGETAGTAAQVTFTNNMDTVDAKVHKIWQDNNNEKGKRPEVLGVLLSNDTRVELKESNGWTATVTGLPAYDHITGEAISYTWTEDTVGNGYTLISATEEDETDGGAVIQSTTLTNGPDTHYNPLTSFSGSKTWQDDGTNRPDWITVILYKGEGANKTEVERKNIEGTAGSNVWTYNFSNLPIFDEQGNEIIYSIGEELPAGYTDSYFSTISTTPPDYRRDPSHDSVYVNEPNNEMTISTGVNLGFVVIKHGNIFRIWTPRKASDSEIEEIKQKVLSASIGDSEFSQIEFATGDELINVYGVPASVPMKNNNQNHANFWMDGEDVEVSFTGKQWSQIAWGQLAYTYTPGTGQLVNSQKLTDFEFHKKWLDTSTLEIPWDQDIEVKVERNKADGTKDETFSLTYSLPASAITNGAEILSKSDVDNGTANDPKLIVHVTTESEVVKYRFELTNLAFFGTADGKYTYYVTETNSRLEGYYEPSYTSASVPTGGSFALDQGTIINQQEGGAELPSTGGPGTHLIHLAGAVLTMIGILLLCRRRSV